MYCILKVCVIYLILVRVCRVYHTYFQGPVGRRAFLFRFIISRLFIFIDLLSRDYLLFLGFLFSHL
nr:MAG TPA: hypothetical protein [Caudoviricetes sp.]